MEKNWVKLEDVKEGDVLIADEGFDCMAAGSHIVKALPGGCLFVTCMWGGHLLDGQLDQEGRLVGFRKEEK